MFTFLHQSKPDGNDFATKDTKNGNGEEECYDNDNGSDTKINKGHKGKQRQ